MKKPVTFYPDTDIKEKLDSKLEETGMDKDEYLSYLINLDSEEVEDEEIEENDDDEEPLSGLETLGRIEDITSKNDLIASLEERNEILAKRLAEYEEGEILAKIFNVLEGHTLRVSEKGKDYPIKSKAHLLECLVHNYYINFDYEEHGITEQEWFDEDEE